MKRFLIPFLILLTACSPRVTVDVFSPRPQNQADQRVAVLEEGAPKPKEAQRLGSLRVEDSGSSQGYMASLYAASKEVWKAGGNALLVQQSRRTPGSLWTMQSRLFADILYVENPDSTSIGPYLRDFESLNPAEKKTWEVSFGISGMPLSEWTRQPLGADHMRRYGPMSATELYDNSFYARTTGFFAVQAAWKFHRKWALTGSVGFCHTGFTFVNPSTGAKEGYQSSVCVTALAGIRYYYVSRPYFKMYCAGQLGLRFQSSKPEVWTYYSEPERHLGLQMTFCGMQFGKKWFAEVECYGIGDYYVTLLPFMGGRIGVGYRF
jgi:hypothetical protein